MAIKVFYPNAIVFPDALPDIGQLEKLSPEFGFEDITIKPAGGVFPGFTGSRSKKPMFDDQTTQIKQILDRCDADYIAHAFSNEIIKYQWQQGANLATRIAFASTTDHLVLQSSYALLAWSSISATDGAEAKITFTIKPISVGGNAPLVQVAEAINAVPVAETYKLGPVVLNTGGGATVLCVDGWTINNNITYKEKVCSGGKYYEYCAVEESRPEATVDLEDNTVATGLLPDGKPITGVDFYLRKLLQGSIEVPAATAQHIRISAVAGTAKPTNTGQIKLQLHGLTTATGVALP